MSEISGTSEETSDTGAGGGVFTEPERERLVAAFRAGNATATEAELGAFLAWAQGLRLDGGMLTLVLQGLAVPVRSQDDEGYQFRATNEGQPG
jgi:hypothetical protein